MVQASLMKPRAHRLEMGFQHVKPLTCWPVVRLVFKIFTTLASSEDLRLFWHSPIRHPLKLH